MYQRVIGPCRESPDAHPGASRQPRAIPFHIFWIRRCRLPSKPYGYPATRPTVTRFKSIPDRFALFGLVEPNSANYRLNIKPFRPPEAAVLVLVHHGCSLLSTQCGDLSRSATHVSLPYFPFLYLPPIPLTSTLSLSPQQRGKQQILLHPYVLLPPSSSLSFKLLCSWFGLLLLRRGWRGLSGPPLHSHPRRIPSRGRLRSR